MKTLEDYISSVEYINCLTFEYIVTYSLQRGAEYELNLDSIKRQYNRLTAKKNKRDSLTIIEERQRSELFARLNYPPFIVNENGQFHPSSKKTHTFQLNDPITKRLKMILKTEIKEIPSWMCGIIYRDAVIFYDKTHKVVSTLNICLSCGHMGTGEFNHINGDHKTYDLLKELFLDIGHEVE